MPTTGWEIDAEPISVGEILQEEFLAPMNMSQSQLAKQIDCDVKTINRICKGHTYITVKTALGLAKVFGTTPEFWLNLQMLTDLWQAKNKQKQELIKACIELNNNKKLDKEMEEFRNSWNGIE
jgi:addiction module HigA family antidote